jgi:hypothetical protein
MIAAARTAGYSGNSTRIERRLAGEIALERKKLAGMNGHHDPATISRRDVHRVLRVELARIADHFGPNRDHIQAQTLRDLARQVRPSDAREHLKRVDTQLHREARNGAPLPRTLKIRELCRDLIAEIGKLSGPEGDAPHITSEERELVAQVQPAAPMFCARHPSIEITNNRPCSLCGLDPVRRWRAEDDEAMGIGLPQRY